MRLGALALGLALLVVGCTTSPSTRDAAMCLPVTLGCPGTPPSYATDIAPLVGERCVVCHFPGTTIAPTDLSTYDRLRRQGGTTLGMVQSCLMPPPDAGVLSEAERTELVQWLRCGAPNN